VVCLGLSLLVGIVVYKAIELPLNHRLQRLMRLRAVQIESAS
jgi:peptidoglycan/LPS O-acetylase OafA/YrhL